MKTYTIMQRVESTNHWEPIPEGDFSTYEAAEAAMEELEENLGWTNLSIRETVTIA